MIRVRGAVTRALVVSLVAIVLGVGCQSDDDSSTVERQRDPNILLIVSDDQRWDSLRDMPSVDVRQEWARFGASFVNEPQCCPARATILTGRYAHRHGVETLRDGEDLDESVTIATLLQDAGYRTGFYGKYLNGYPFERGNYVPLGWDEFGAYVGATEYFDFTLNENGTAVEYGQEPDDYSTDVFTDKAREFIASTDADQPFFLYAAYNAPHFSSSGLAVPAPRHEGDCADIAIAYPPNFNARDTVSQPAWMEESNDARPALTEMQIRATCEALRGLDESVASLIDQLDRTGRLDDTYIVFTSDNGHSFGEHRLFGKGHLYEESVRVPLLVSGPGVRAGSIDRLTSNVDLTPTILDWTRVRAPKTFVDGHSFAADLRGDTPDFVPEDILLQGCRTQRTTEALPQADESVDPPLCGGYAEEMGTNWGVRTATHKYIEYPDGSVQLFDLDRDPYEMTNLADDPSQASLIVQLRDRLRELRAG